MSGVRVVANGYNAKNDDNLAGMVVHRINEMLNEDDKAWGSKGPFCVTLEIILRKYAKNFRELLDKVDKT